MNEQSSNNTNIFPEDEVEFLRNNNIQIEYLDFPDSFLILVGTN